MTEYRKYSSLSKKSDEKDNTEYSTKQTNSKIKFKQQSNNNNSSEEEKNYKQKKLKKETKTNEENSNSNEKDETEESNYKHKNIKKHEQKLPPKKSNTVLQEKLKKILMDREKGKEKYEYTKQEIPEYLKYNSDDSESSEISDIKVKKKKKFSDRKENPKNISKKQNNDIIGKKNTKIHRNISTKKKIQKRKIIHQM